MKIIFEHPDEYKTFHHFKEGALFTAKGITERAVFMKITPPPMLYDNKAAPAPNSVSMNNAVTFHFKGDVEVHEYPDAELLMGGRPEFRGKVEKVTEP